MLDHTWNSTPIRRLPRRTISEILSARPHRVLGRAESPSEPIRPTDLATAQWFWLRLEIELIIRALLGESH